MDYAQAYDCAPFDSQQWLDPDVYLLLLEERRLSGRCHSLENVRHSVQLLQRPRSLTQDFPRSMVSTAQRGT